MKDSIDRDQFIALLKSLIENERTTTIYVSTDDKQLITVGIDQGQIVSLRCGIKRGERAIPMISNMRSGTYRLDEKSQPHPNVGIRLPPTEVLLHLLSGEDRSEGDERGGKDHAIDSQWVHDALCKVLVQYMGPIAPVVCREAIDAVGGVDSPEKVRRAVDRLADEINDTAEAERFRAQAQSELETMQQR